ncbi:MAG: hypothetical protein NTV23_08410 [Propionibacteriales bacterium]|nr:hypothetical protein [Propionibacteriales bacterium]
MNQRKSTGPVTGQLVAALVVVLVLVVGLVYFFVLRDDDEKDNGTSSTGSLTAKTFDLPGIPFTFEYPGNFALNDGPQGYVWIGGIGPYDMINVKRLANQPNPVARLKKSSREALTKVPGLTITSEGTESRGGIELVKFVADTILGDKTLHSQFFYFVAGQVTWQLECESNAERAAIDAACARALDTFAVR